MATPRDRRLQADFEKVNRLVNESGGALRLVRTTGTPPVSYVIGYHCPSLVKDAGGNLTVGMSHRVEINLGANYPLEKPNARMLTAVFNPHVFSHQAICLGIVWSASETLDTLILKIGALLQLDPKVLDQKSPANAEANQWVQQNRARLPLGHESFKAPTKPASRVEWG